MRFAELITLSGVTVRELRGDAEITAVAVDSRQSAGGTCFIAVRGPTDDGHKYIPSAVAAGCSAVVCQDPSAVPKDVPCAVVESSQTAAGPLAQAFFGWPSRKLTTVGVTGTKGKSTVAYIVRSIFRQAGFSPALLGTISYEIGPRILPANNTTPGPVELAAMCAEIVAAGGTHLVMEVSSHALHQQRTGGVDFRVGVFTNLSGDHLDYHKTMEDYLLAKRLLFEQLAPGATAVINRDVAEGERMAQSTRAGVVWFGLSSASDYWARIVSFDTRGTRFSLIHGGDERPVSISLIGRHNVYNCLAAVGACASLGIDMPTIVAGLEAVRNIPGRMERVHVDAPYQVFVDYAHTDDALDKALSAIRPITPRRIIVVFGCGGNRDRTKRPRMARAAERLADRIVITSDNPRNEDPNAIIDEITAGLSLAGWQRTQVQADRRAAIRLALEQAGEGDVVVIAGKGHEKYQIVGDQKHHFDDVEVVEQILGRQEARL